MKAIRVHAPGGPESMKLEDVAASAPAAGQAQVKLEACGVNYIDVYFRTGAYKAPLPLTPGMEGAGTVTAVGPGVSDVKVGDRVAWTGVIGSYAQMLSVATDRLVALPTQLTFKDGAAAMLQGLTAHYLVTSTWPLKKGETALVQAAAGGMGLLLCQMAKMRGATVIGTVSTEEKAALAKAAGADHVILYTKQDFEPEVKRVTGGRGVDVVYDGVGASTFDKGLNSLRARGQARHRRARGRGGVRRRGSQHLRQGPQLPAAPRPHGALRGGERPGGSAPPPAAGSGRGALCHAGA